MSGAAFDRTALMAAMRATAALPPRAVQVPQWGTVYVRALTVADVESAAEKSRAAADDADGAPRPARSEIARGVARILCDDQGVLLFDPESAADVTFLASQPWALLRRLTRESEQAVEAGGKNALPSASAS